MSTKLKAGTATSGAVIDADTTGILELQSGSTPTTAITVDASQNTKFVGKIQSNATGTPPTFADSAGTQIGTLCRAWALFNGATSTINGSFNVSSISRVGTGNYNVNYTNALPSSAHACVALIPYASWGAASDADVYGGPVSTTQANIQVIQPFAAYYDGTQISFAAFA